MRTGRTRAIAAIAVIGLVSVGCFKISGFRLTKPVLSSNEKTVLELSLHKMNIGGEKETKSYIFVALRVPKPEGGSLLKTTSPRMFDVNGRFGTPRRLLVDNGLRDALLMGGNETCSSLMHEAGDQFKLIVLRAEKRTDPGAAGMNAEALTRIGMILKSEEPVPGGSLPFQVLTGAWADDVNGDGAGVPGENEVVCTSAVTSWLTVRPDPGAEPTVSSDSMPSLDELRS